MKKEKILSYIVMMVSVLTIGILSGCGANTEEQLDYRTQGIALMDQGQYEAALEMFNNALGESVGVVSDVEEDICKYKGIALYKLERYDEAIEVYNAVIEFDDKDPYAYYYRGTIYLECGDKDSAVADYSQACALESTFDMYTAVAENLKQNGYETEANGYLQQALILEPKDNDEKRQQAYLYYMSGDEETAKATYEALAVEGDEESLVYLAKFAVDAADYDTALSYIQQGLAMNGEFYGEFLYQEGVCYEFKEDYAGAYEIFTQYLELYPDDEAAQREATFLSTRE